jgi:hypothetical protein
VTIYIAPNGRMTVHINELGRMWKGSVVAKIEVGPGGTERNNEKLKNSRCPSKPSDTPPK